LASFRWKAERSEVWLYDTRTLEPSLQVPINNQGNQMPELIFSADGSRLLVGHPINARMRESAGYWRNPYGERPFFRLYELSTAEERFSDDDAEFLAEVSGGQAVLTRSKNSDQLEVWDLSTRQLKASSSPETSSDSHRSKVSASPDGRWVMEIRSHWLAVKPGWWPAWLRPRSATTKLRYDLRLLEADTLRERGRLTIDRSGSYSGDCDFVFSPDGSWIVAGGGDRVSIWRIPPTRPWLLLVCSAAGFALFGVCVTRSVRKLRRRLFGD